MGRVESRNRPTAGGGPVVQSLDCMRRRSSAQTRVPTRRKCNGVQRRLLEGIREAVRATMRANTDEGDVDDDAHVRAVTEAVGYNIPTEGLESHAYGSHPRQRSSKRDSTALASSDAAADAVAASVA